MMGLKRVIEEVSELYGGGGGVKGYQSSSDEALDVYRTNTHTPADPACSGTPRLSGRQLGGTGGKTGFTTKIKVKH